MMKKQSLKMTDRSKSETILIIGKLFKIIYTDLEIFTFYGGEMEFGLGPRHTQESVFQEFRAITLRVHPGSSHEQNPVFYYEKYLRSVVPTRWRCSSLVDQIKRDHYEEIIECWVFDGIVMITANRAFVKFAVIDEVVVCAPAPDQAGREVLYAQLVHRYAQGYAPPTSLTCRELNQKSHGAFARPSL